MRSSEWKTLLPGSSCLCGLWDKPWGSWSLVIPAGFKVYHDSYRRGYQVLLVWGEASWPSSSKPSSPKAVSILGCQWEVVACWLFLDVLSTSGFSFLWTRSDWQCRCSNSFSGGLEGSMESAQLWASLLKKKHASCWACRDAAQLQGSGAW